MTETLAGADASSISRFERSPTTGPLRSETRPIRLPVTRPTNNCANGFIYLDAAHSESVTQESVESSWLHSVNAGAQSSAST